MEAKQLKTTDAKQDAYQFLRDFIRSTATSRLKSCTKNQTFEVREITKEEDFSYDHWIAAIVISATTIRVNFRVHFTTKSAREFVAHNPVLSGIEDPNVCHDFIREYCNLTAGAIKQGLERVSERDISADGYIVNLPHETPAYDKIGKLTRTVEQDSVRDCWAFKLNGQELVCATRIEIVDWASIGKITEMDLSSLLVSDDGNVEFL